MSLSVEAIGKTFYRKHRVVFITLRGEAGKLRHSMIGWANDFVRPISDCYFIVKEPDTTNGRYHFHVLAELKVRQIPKRWFRKHIHINVSPVTKGFDPVTDKEPKHLPLSGVPIEKPPKFVGLSVAQVDEAVAIQQTAKIVECVKAFYEYTHHINRVVRYMLKGNPSQTYVDYILRT